MGMRDLDDQAYQHRVRWLDFPVNDDNRYELGYAGFDDLFYGIGCELSRDGDDVGEVGRYRLYRIWVSVSRGGAL